MNSKEFNYIVLLKTGSQHYYLLWRDGGETPDGFVLLSEMPCFLSGRTLEDLLDKAEKFGLQVVEQEPVTTDMNKIFKALAALRPQRPSSQRTCQLLLDGWNTLEDMARSIGINQNVTNLSTNKILRIAYDKLFYGNNLPSVTPENKSYRPLFSSDERKVIRAYFRHLWQGYLNKMFS